MDVGTASNLHGMEGVSQLNQLKDLMGLSGYKDTGISLEEIRSVTLRPSKKMGDRLADIPWIILERLIRLDYTCIRDKTVHGIFTKNKSHIHQGLKFHAMDVFLAIFESCDMIVQQVLAKKMSSCRLALPFIIPSFDESESDSETLVSPFWAFRSINLQWMNSTTGSAVDVVLPNYPFKYVAFCRLGEERLAMSKSRIVNEVISSRTSTFYDRETRGSKAGRMCNGLVEMFYHLPKTSGNDDLQECLIFNLRGNGIKHSKQVDILAKIASVIVCFVDSTHLFESATISKLESLKQKCKGIIIQVTDEVDEEINLPEELSQFDFSMLNAAGNAKDTAYDLADMIGDMLKKSPGGTKSLDDMKDEFRQNGILLDIDRDEWKLSKTCEKDIFLNIQAKDIAEKKKTILPMQGQDLLEWTRLLKEKFRGKKFLNEEEAQRRNADLDKKMKVCRDNQLAYVGNIDESVRKFIVSQKKMVDDIRCEKISRIAYLIFEKKLKLELDDISRTILPKLRQEYKKVFESCGEATLESKKAIEEAGKKLDDSSFGLEHLFREIGQIYECVHVSSDRSEYEHYLSELPDIAAMYFLTGHSIELMNGDSGAVPLKWITAVFESLHKLIGEKKMYVLSVVGLQSSGKSTLLNTMFGLELAVGAGRCTRGVYAQLLPVDKDKTNFPVDYILVLDSEGLCSTTMKGTSEHDNEIATLVIGLAELTIVNIMGENKEKMTDIFSIAVNAFLRMQCVKEFKTQKCIFLHHNVSAVSAPDDLMTENHRLQAELDAITSEAAKENNAYDKIKEFKHVITFNSKQDIFYVPNLWNGEPPMAHVEPAYSDKIKKIREHIILEIEKLPTQRGISVLNMKTRIEDIWEGVLSDDFIFNFNNNLDLKAYLSVEKKYCALQRKFERTLMSFVTESCKTKIENCDSQHTLDITSQKLDKEFTEKQDEWIESTLDELREFWQENDWKYNDIKFREKKITMLKMAMVETAFKIKGELKYIFNCKCVEMQQLSFDKTSIIKEAEALAEDMKDGKLQASEILPKFEKIWDQWQGGLNLNAKSCKFNVAEECDRVLHIVLQEDRTVYLKGVSNACEFIEEKDLNKLHLDYKKIDIDNRVFAGTTAVPNLPGRETFFPEVVAKVNEVLAELKIKLKEMAQKNNEFEPKLAYEAVEFVLDAIRSHNQLPYNECIFTFKPAFEVMIATRAANIARIHFEELNKKYEETLGITGKLAEFKAELLAMFSNHVTQNFLYEKVVHQLTTLMRREQTENVLEKILEKVHNQKHGLLVSILKDLAEKESFPEYKSFIEQDLYSYVQDWIETSMGKEIFRKENGSSSYLELVDFSLTNYMNKLRKGMEKVVSEVDDKDCIKMVKFVDDLIDEYSDIISFSKEDGAILKNMEITNFADFQKAMNEQFDKAEICIRAGFEKDGVDNVKWTGVSPYKQALEKLWGCHERCPLCLAPCMFTSERHLVDDNKQHECLLHWPDGFCGTRWTESQKLRTEVCTFSITTGSSFGCSASRYRCSQSAKCKREREDNDSAGNEDDIYHPYRNYKDYLQGWMIAPDNSGDALKYWQWMIAKFRKELAEYHNAKEPDIDIEWNQNKQAAVESLSRYLHK